MFSVSYYTNRIQLKKSAQFCSPPSILSINLGIYLERHVNKLQTHSNLAQKCWNFHDLAFAIIHSIVIHLYISVRLRRVVLNKNLRCLQKVITAYIKQRSVRRWFARLLGDFGGCRWAPVEIAFCFLSLRDGVTFRANASPPSQSPLAAHPAPPPWAAELLLVNRFLSRELHQISKRFAANRSCLIILLADDRVVFYDTFGRCFQSPGFQFSLGCRATTTYAIINCLLIGRLSWLIRNWTLSLGEYELIKLAGL